MTIKIKPKLIDCEKLNICVDKLDVKVDLGEKVTAFTDKEFLQDVLGGELPSEFQLLKAYIASQVISLYEQIRIAQLHKKP